jgi:hypothetical protein
VEYGVLIARGEEGNNKYPTRTALTSLLDLRDRLHAKPFNVMTPHRPDDIKTPFEVSWYVCHMTLSVGLTFIVHSHICNDWAKELGEGSNGIICHIVA